MSSIQALSLLLLNLCLLVCSTAAQTSDEGCYVGGDLIPENELQQYNASKDIGFLHISTSNPVLCSGRVRIVEVCMYAQLISLGIENNGTATSIRTKMYLLRFDNLTSFYKQVGNAQTIDIRISNTTIQTYCCKDNIRISANWIAQPGDVFGVSTISECRNRTNTILCPGQSVVNPTQANKTAATVLFYNSRLVSSVPINLLTPSHAIVNIRATVEPTPPALPESCALYPQPTPSCVTTLQPPSQGFSIGSVETNLDPKRRVHGGGTYITLQRAQYNGTATTIDYCGFLDINHKPTVTQYRFTLAKYREENGILKLTNSQQMFIDNATPAVRRSDTVHCEHDKEINSRSSWDVQEGDRFGVFILHDCGDLEMVCPVQLTQLSNKSCQGSLFQPSERPTKNINIADNEYLSSVPVEINIRVSIRPSNSDYVKRTLKPPLCSASSMRPSPTSLPSPTPPTPPTPPSVSNGVVVMGSLSTIVILALFITILVFLVVLLAKKFKKRKILNNLSMPSTVSEGIEMTLVTQVNDRGIMRRNSIRTQSVRTSSTSTMRQRIMSIPNNYSGMSTPMNNPFLQSREKQTQELNSKALSNYEVGFGAFNSKALSNYEVGFGDYAAPIFSPANKSEELTQQLETIGVIEVPEEQLEFEEELGSGQFGTVYKALWTYPESLIPQDDIPNLPKAAQVAVKVMEGQLVEDRIKFLQEAVLLGQFNDPNIVAIFGVVTTSTRLMMICELMDRDLRNQLHMCRSKLEKYTSTPEDYHTELPAMLLSYSRKIASSMVYLGLKGFVHRDLAARNILVSNEGDCKISDFGMSRDLQDETYYMSHEGLVPVKWTAPEAVKHKKYSFKSDVWSYGILLYEIWSLGYKPYHDMSNMEVVAKVETGYRLPPPPGCPKNIYSIMIRCTHPETKARPTFTQILVDLQRPDYQLLKWTADDVRTGSGAARILGAPLEEGFCLYKDLQSTYLGPTAVTSL